MTKQNTDLRSVDGQTIYLPPEIGGASGQGNLSLPNVYSQTATAQYPIGTRFVNGNRTYHYGYFGTAVTYNTTAVGNYGAFLLSWSNSYDTAYTSGSTNKVKVDGTSDGVPIAHALAGGYLFIWASTAIGRIQMRVVDNLAAESASPYSVELELEQNIPIDIAANTAFEVYANQYADMRTAWAGAQSGDYMAFVGLPTTIVTAERYGWVLTWGPCFIVAAGTETGADSYDRQLVFMSDGSVGLAGDQYNTPLSNQIAGYALNRTSSANADQWMMLTLDP